MYVDLSVRPFGEFAPDRPTPRRPVQAAFCITLYNERLASLLKTVRSLLQSLAHQAVAKGVFDACLCLMIDGLDTADPDLVAWLNAKGLTRLDAQLWDGCEFHISDHALDDLERQTGSSRNGQSRSARASVRVVLCIKRRNRGKLHSHAVFFRNVCAWLQPEHCYQVDAGTTIAQDAIARLSARLDADPECAAIAPRVLIERPGVAARFLPAWQYVDFLMQKAVYWPFEVAMGHLGVVPGQFCVFRWSALRGDGADHAGIADDAPLHAYLRGISSRKPLERIMYLAEDRVMGSELVMAPRRAWRLRYASDVVATTDACLSLGELFRQRRRWNNSTLACRAWLLAAWPGLLRRSDRPMRDKAGFGLAMLGQLLLTALDMTAPANLACSLLALLKIVASVPGPAGAGVQVGLGVALTLAALLSVGGAAGAGALVSGVRVASGFSAFALLAVACLLVLPPLAVVVLFAPTLIAQVAMLRMARGEVRAVWANMHIFALTNLLTTTCLSAYAIWNLHDVSWGTKGLTVLKPEDKAPEQLLFARGVAIGVWAGLNLALIVAGYRVAGATSALLNPVIEAGCVTGVIVSLIAGIGRRSDFGKTKIFKSKILTKHSAPA